jgi:hypothetical protein
MPLKHTSPLPSSAADGLITNEQSSSITRSSSMALRMQAITFGRLLSKEMHEVS